MDSTVHPVDERLPSGKLAALGLQHVLVMYAGAVAVPLIVGRALKLSPEQVALLISADLFVCGLVTLIQSWGMTQWFGIRLPVMMGVTFAAVAPMVSMANANPGEMGAQMIFGAIIGAGIVSMLIAPAVSRMLRFFPPVVTGTIIAVIGISLMRIGINWIFGNPFGPTAPSIVNPEHKQWLDAAAAAATAPGSALPPLPKDLALLPKMPNPKYADLTGVGIAGVVLLSILLISKYAKGFIANISVLLGIIIGLWAKSFEQLNVLTVFFITPLSMVGGVFNTVQMLPPWLRFVSGVVDTEDLPLNVSREMLQATPVLGRIRKAVTGRVLSELKTRTKDAEDYAKFWENFGACRKEGLYEDKGEYQKDILKLGQIFGADVSTKKSLADNLKAIEKWDGKLPQYMLGGNTTPFVNVGK